MFPWNAWKAPQLNFSSEIDYFARPGVDLHASETPVRFRDTLEGMKVPERFGVELSTLREEIRRRNYSIRTEHAYETWVMRYLTFHDCQDPRNRVVYLQPAGNSIARKSGKISPFHHRMREACHGIGPVFL